MSSRPLRLATRSSPLARRQAELVSASLGGESAGVELVFVESRGDRDTSVPIERLGGQGAFVTEVEQAVLDGVADVAVHSAKDLPSFAPPAGLVLAAVPARGEVRDALVGRPLDELAPGALIATGSPRRRAQLAAFRPDLSFVGLRGNIGTRLSKVPEGGAAVVAVCALERLGLLERIAEVLPTSVVLPQVGQGALALRCREGDRETVERLAAVDDAVTHRALLAERAFLAALGGGCDAPVAGLARCLEDATVEVEGLLASHDGHVVLRRRERGEDPEATGRLVAERLVELDGGELLTVQW